MFLILLLLLPDSVVQQDYKIWWGMIFFGGHLIELWQKEGVNHAHVSKIQDASTGIYFITHDSSGHNFSYFRKDSAASQITPEHLPYTYIASAKVLHISAISQAISPSSNNTVNAAIQIANKNDVLISYDTNLRFKLWSLELTSETIQKTIPFSDFLFPSLEDSIILTELTEQIDIVEKLFEKRCQISSIKTWIRGRSCSK